MRVTVDIDEAVLREVKAIHQKEGRSTGAVVSELLADALAQRRTMPEQLTLRWTARPMKALVDLADRAAVHAALGDDRS